MTANLFLILAVKDISKSDFSEKEMLTAENGNNTNRQSGSNQRNIIRDEGFDSMWSRQSSVRCLKFILKPLNDFSSLKNADVHGNIIPNSNEFVTAFEFIGQVSLSSSGLIGSILEIRGALDFCRGVLLLHAERCSLKYANINANANANTNVNVIPNVSESTATNDPIVLDEELLNDMIDDNLFEYDSFL